MQLLSFVLGAAAQSALPWYPSQPACDASRPNLVSQEKCIFYALNLFNRLMTLDTAGWPAACSTLRGEFLLHARTRGN